jgi:hypothetical protein
MNKLIKNKHSIALMGLILIVFTFLVVNKVNAEDSVPPKVEDSSTMKNIPKPPIPGTIPEKIRAGVDSRLQNVKNNQETREDMVKNGRLPSTTLPKIMREEQRFASSSKMRIEDRERIGSTTPKMMRDERFSSTSPRIGERPEKDFRASTTRPFLKKDGYENEGRAMVEKMLKERKDGLVKQLNVAIQNLTDLRKRISSRIEKDKLAGKDISSVSELLKVADTKLSLAKDAVKAVQNYVPTTKDQTVNTDTTNTQTASSTKLINLDQVRTLVDKARSAIKDAHKALVDVVVAIAKISGNNNLPKDSKEGRPTVTPTPVPSTTISASSTNQ